MSATWACPLEPAGPGLCIPCAASPQARCTREHDGKPVRHRAVTGWHCAHARIMAGPCAGWDDTPAECGYGCKMHPDYARVTS